MPATSRPDLSPGKYNNDFTSPFNNNPLLVNGTAALPNKALLLIYASILTGNVLRVL
jgi:hypothetical protein